MARPACSAACATWMSSWLGCERPPRHSMITTRRRFAAIPVAASSAHGAAAMDLQNALRSERYHALQDTLKQAIERPMLLDAAREPCRTCVPPWPSPPGTS